VKYIARNSLFGLLLSLIVFGALSFVDDHFFKLRSYISNYSVSAMSRIIAKQPQGSESVAVATPGYVLRTIRLAGIDVFADVSDTGPKRELGLSGRDNLAPDRGMLFIFKYPDTYGFWMNEMKFPIDILWIDENKILIDYVSNLSPQTYPKVFYPKQKALYVLELPSGFADTNKVKVGQKLEF
jgi:uncharacterized membrane protein (UPF0127 family)